MKTETYTEIENYFKQFFETEDIETKTISVKNAIRLCDAYVYEHNKPPMRECKYCGAMTDQPDEHGCTLHFLREKAGHAEMDIYFKSKETWLEINKLLDENL